MERLQAGKQGLSSASGGKKGELEECPEGFQAAICGGCLSLRHRKSR